jgi:predicted permease
VYKPRVISLPIRNEAYNMISVLIKAFSFIFIIVLGYTLKKLNFFKPNDYKLISRIVISITLPAAVINAFSNFKKDGSLFLLVLIGFLINVFLLSLGYIMSKRKDPKSKALYMINMQGYNIGCFALPFIQGFLGPAGVIATCMFDTGNAIICTGTSYAVTSNVVQGNSKLDLKSVGRKLLSSAPFCTYMLMLIISIIGIRIPAAMLTIVSPIASANGFLAMLMIGMMFEIQFEPEHIKSVSTILLSRFLIAAALAGIFYYLTPFSLVVRQVLAILVFSPISGLGPVFTEMCGGDSTLAGFANSISILISMVAIITLVVVMGVGM